MDNVPIHTHESFQLKKKNEIEFSIRAPFPFTEMNQR